MISISIKEIKGLEAALKRKGEALSKKVDAEMAATVADINAQQKAAAPVDFGLLRSSLKFDRNSALNYTIVSSGAGSSYAPYQEFGTGGLATIPSGLESEAGLFHKQGGRVQNMKPTPFFFAPAFREWKELKKRIEALLGK